MGLIQLEGMEFWAYHGLYSGEEQIGNRFSVDVELELDVTKAGETDDVSHTLDYYEVYVLVKEHMAVRHRCLESVSHTICKAIYHRYGNVGVVRVRVCKHNPPFGGLTQRACVRQELRR